MAPSPRSCCRRALSHKESAFLCVRGEARRSLCSSLARRTKLWFAGRGWLARGADALLRRGLARLPPRVVQVILQLETELQAKEDERADMEENLAAAFSEVVKDLSSRVTTLTAERDRLLVSLEEATHRRKG